MECYRELLIWLSRRGYGWYVAIKGLKAAWSVPAFLIFIPILVACAAVWIVWEFGKSLHAILLGSIAELVEFWDRRWFTGFSRQHYNRMLDRWHLPYPVKAPAELDREKGE